MAQGFFNEEKSHEDLPSLRVLFGRRGLHFPVWQLCAGHTRRLSARRAISRGQFAPSHLCCRRRSALDREEKPLLVSQAGNEGHGIHPRRCRPRSEEHTSELQSHVNLVCRLLLEKKKNTTTTI